jgi:hypothetical protein
MAANSSPIKPTTYFHEVLPKFGGTYDPNVPWCEAIVVPTAYVWQDVLHGLIGCLLQQLYDDAYPSLAICNDERSAKRFRNCIPGSLHYVGHGMYEFRPPRGTRFQPEQRIYVGACATHPVCEWQTRNRKDYKFDVCWIVDGVPGDSGPYGERSGAATLLRGMFEAWTSAQRSRRSAIASRQSIAGGGR